ncbi:MAG: beta-propeller domain-containing protein [Clostridia bacterium]|nr:beta-propeller domain-containing protein [Deltaproteobacteria bacterium]
MLKRFLAVGCLVGLAACSDTQAPDIGARTSTSAALKQFNSCDALAKALRANLKEEARTTLLQFLDDRYSGLYGRAEDTAGFETPSSASADNAARTPEEGVDYSGTNNQEAGVDEADFVKTDGTHMYVLNSQSLYVIAVPSFGQLQESSNIAIEGYPTAMLIKDDIVIVLSTVYPTSLTDEGLRAKLTGPTESSFRTQNLTKMTFVNVSDRANPAATREIYIEGYYQTARRIDASARIVSYGYIDTSDVYFYPKLPDTDSYSGSDAYRDAVKNAVPATIAYNERVIADKPLRDFVPNIYERVGGIIREHDYDDDDCSTFAIADDSYSRGLTSIVSFDLNGTGFEADHIVTNEGQVYASKDTLIIAEPAYQSWWYYANATAYDDSTNIHRFDIATPGITTYTGSGRVAGAVNSPFNLSEQNGVVRVASTSNQWGRWWEESPPPVSSNVFTLSGESSLEVQGNITGSSEGEQLWATRFVDDKAYLITFRFSDPLFVVDLGDVARPKMLGELKVPGVSTYVHPVDPAHLLSIGLGGTENAVDWGTTQISLFNVADSASPLLSATLALNTAGSWAWSEALYEHKAFQYWAPKALLAVPIGSYYYSGNYHYVSTLDLVAVGSDSLDRRITIDHSAFFDDASDWYSDPSIRRSIFMGEFIIAVSDRAVTASRLSDGATTATIRLPGTKFYYGTRAPGYAD